MKKAFTIIALLATITATAEPAIRFPIFGKKKYKGTRCGWKSDHRRSRKQVVVAVGTFALTFIAAGVAMDKSRAY